jgi:hypothetical protein
MCTCAPALVAGGCAVTPGLQSLAPHAPLQVHHANYIKNVNNAIKNYTQLSNATLTELISQVGTGQLPSEVETAVRERRCPAWLPNVLTEC